MTLLVVSLSAIVASGFGAVQTLLGVPRSNRAAVVLQSVLGAGLGVGLASCSLFAIGVVADGLSRSVLVGEAVVLVGAAIGLWLLARRSQAWEVEPPDSDTPIALLRVLAATLAVAAVIVLWRCVTVSGEFPHGQWDAWAIWNTRARFFVRADENWTAAFMVGGGHPDYPLLLPLTIARLWTCLGSETTVVPRVVSIASAFGCAALLTSALAALRGREQAWLGGLVLLTTPAFVVRATWQMADIPLAFFFLATLVSLCIADERGRTTIGALVLAGALAGLAAWTKNEGVLFALLVVVAQVGQSVAGMEWRNARPRIVAICAGMAPIAAILLYFKLSYAPANDLVLGQGLESSWARLTDAGRHWIVVRAFLRMVVPIAGGFVVLLPIYALMRRRWGVGHDWKLGTGTATALTVLVGMIPGYYFVYILTPADLVWHLNTSLARLLIHLWPCVLLLVFTAAAPRSSRAQGDPA